MRIVGTFEAKTRISALLEQAARGEEITITRHGKPIARIVPVATGDARLEGTVARLKTFRRGRRLGDGLSVKALIVERHKRRPSATR